MTNDADDPEEKWMTLDEFAALISLLSFVLGFLLVLKYGFS